MEKQRVALMVVDGGGLDSVLSCVANKLVGIISINMPTDGRLAREIE